MFVSTKMELQFKNKLIPGWEQVAENQRTYTENKTLFLLGIVMT